MQALLAGKGLSPRLVVGSWIELGSAARIFEASVSLCCGEPLDVLASMMSRLVVVADWASFGHEGLVWMYEAVGRNLVFFQDALLAPRACSEKDARQMASLPVRMLFFDSSSVQCMMARVAEVQSSLIACLGRWP